MKKNKKNKKEIRKLDNIKKDKRASIFKTRQNGRAFLALFLVFLGPAFIMVLLIFFAWTCSIQPPCLEIDFLDIGQGDASLLRFPGGEIVLIDGGSDNLLLHRLGGELPFYRRRLDYLVVSHFHDDHIFGLIEVLRRYRVRYLVFGADLETGLIGEILLAEAALQGTEYIIIEGEGKIFLPAGRNNGKDKQVCYLWFLNPLSLGVRPDGNNSLLIKTSCGARRFLFSGDNEYKVEALLASSGLDLRAEIFKASHHGSKTSNSLEFLTVVSPEIMVVSVGKDNKFNHPSLETLSTAAFLGIEVRRTDQEGVIKFKEN